MMLAVTAGKRTPLVIAVVVFLMMVGLTIALVLPREKSVEEGPPPAEVGEPQEFVLSTVTPDEPKPAATAGAAATRTAVPERPAKPGAVTTAPAPAAPAARPAPATAPGPVATAKPKANAADFYRKAFSLMRAGQRKVMARAEKAAESGWVAGDGPVESLLAQNQPAFEEFRKGVACGECRFVKEGAAMSDAPLPHLGPAVSLAGLVVAEGRRLAAQGDLTGSADCYLGAAKLAEDIRQDRTLACLDHSQSILSIAFPPLAERLQKGKLAKDSLETALAQFRRFEADGVALGDCMAGEITLATRLARTVLQNEGYITGEKLASALPQVAKAALLRVPVEQRRKYVADALAAFDDCCVRIFSVAQTMRREDVQRLSADLDATRVQTKTPAFGGKPEQMGRYLAFEFVPRLGPKWHNHADDQLKRRALLALSAVRLSQAREGNWPESLVALVPSLLKAVPTDPFDPQAGALRYRVVGVEAALWSVGHDGKDDAQVSASKAGVAGKDLVYWLR